VTTPLTPQIGDSVYLASLFANLHIHGIISDLDTPDQVSASLEVSGGNGLLSLAAIQGPKGAQGEPAFLLKLQLQIFDSTDDLPTNLTVEDIDVGKYWIVRVFDDDSNAIGSNAWVWFGDHYEGFPMGTQGPAGPVPIISFNIELLDPDDDDLQNQVVVTGDNYHPSVLLKIKAPRGPQGPDAAWDKYDEPTVPDVGDYPGWDGTHYVPTAPPSTQSKCWTMPEAAFVDVPLAIATSVPLGTFLIPPLDGDHIPWVFGHMRITGVEADIDPLIIGIEVRLGNATTGAVVARGYGNISGYVNLSPHASTSATPNDAITPDNGRALIPSGSTGAAATLYVNAFNDGVAGVYHFEKRGAQLSIEAKPV
jgi:hypothetical protein